MTNLAAQTLERIISATPFTIFEKGRSYILALV